MAIENEDIHALKQTISLSAVVRSRGVELKKKGRQLWGLCPFHEDTEPSLRWMSEKGCGTVWEMRRGRGCVELCDEVGRDRL
ncbi:MAG: hypothetical protein IPO41_13745 [Acidobacteria bacterium]|nr:hypothetical protein [Acidobacteriota bacterium]